jgi:hypothetical protein
MPFDPFFSSANKKHYVPNEEFGATMAAVRAMSREDRWKWIREKSVKGAATFIERKVLKALRFERDVQNSYRNRLDGERIACDIACLSAKFRVTVFTGHSTTGTKLGYNQTHSTKSQHTAVTPKRHFERIHRRRRKAATPPQISP